MSEEFAIQQQRPSAMPYALGGAAVGAGSAYLIDRYGTKYATQPGKYNSYEDLLKESNDEFKKSSEGIEESLKTKAENARKAAADARTKYDSDLKAYQEAYKAGEMPPLPADDPAQKALTEAEEKLAAKRTELEKAEIEKLKAANTKAPVEPKKPVNIDKMQTALDTKIAENKALNENLNKKLGELAEKRYQIIESPNEYVKVGRYSVRKEKAISNLDKELETYINGLKGVKNKKALLVESQNVIQNLITGLEYKDAKVPEYGFAKSKAAAEKALKDVTGGATTKDVINKYLKNPGNAENQKQIQRLIDAENKRLGKVENLQTLFNEYAAQAKPEELKKVTKEIKGRIGGKIFGTNFSATITETSEPAKKILSFVENLTKDEKATLERLIGKGELTPEVFENKVNELKGNIKNLESATGTLNTLQGELEKVAGEGAYIKNGKLFNKAGEEVKATMKAPALQNKVEVQNKGIETLKAQIEAAKAGTPAADKAVATLTEEQIAQKAKAAITDEMVKAEKEAVEVAKKAVDDARAKLPKNPEKSLEALAKEFAEKNGSREDVVKKATEGFKNDLKSLIEGKVHSGKLAGILAGGAAAGLLIGMALRPKAKEA